MVRMALGGAGALMGLSIDLVDDLRTAADETCDFLSSSQGDQIALKLFAA